MTKNLEITIICKDFRSRSSSKLLLSLIVSIISGTKGDQTFLNSEEHLLRQLRITTRKLCLSSRLHCFNNELFLLQVWWGKGFIYAYFGYRVGFSLLFFECGSNVYMCTFSTPLEPDRLIDTNNLYGQSIDADSSTFLSRI